MYAQTERYRRPSFRSAPAIKTDRDVAREHRELLSAAVARDSLQAAGLLAMHYRETGRFIQKLGRLASEESAHAARTG
jgi:GntR family carbon starvation induced transcriptional regulator